MSMDVINQVHQVFIAVMLQDIKVVEAKIRDGHDINAVEPVYEMRPIELAIKLNRVDIVELLLGLGATLEGEIELLRDNSTGYDYISILSNMSEDNPTMIKLLIKAGLNLHVNPWCGRGHLRVLLDNGLLDCAKVLVEAGFICCNTVCKSDRYVPEYDRIMSSGHTGLINAVKRQYEVTPREILESYHCDFE